jgi:N-acetylglucosamine-6-sulfatase
VALTVCALMAVGLVGAPSSTSDAMPPPAQAGGSGRPNVILILTDDQRRDDMRWTPRVRRLIGRRGVTFRNAITPNPVCCPTRASLLTGQFTHNNGVLATGNGLYGGFRAHRKGSRNPNNDIGRWMKNAGYTTGFIGKYLNGYSRSIAEAEFGKGSSLGPSGWDHWDATLAGGVNYYDFTFANHGSPERFTDDYITTRATTRATDKIEEWSSPGEAGDKPFFLNLFYAAPHKHQAGGRQSPAKPDPKLPVRVTATNPDRHKKSFNRVPTKSRFSGRSPISPRRMQKHFVGRVKALRSVDRAVERIVTKLEEVGELDNTLIIFTSDNGFSLGQHRWLGKRWPFKVEMQVPLLMRGPGVPAGVSTPKWVTPVDIARTIVDAGNASVQRRLDGRSFLNVNGNESNRARAIPIETGNHRARKKADQKWLYRGLWYGRYIYAKSPKKAELYDLRKDPHQLKNRAKWSAYKEIKRRLADKSRTLGSCRGSSACYRGYFWLPKPRR